MTTKVTGMMQTSTKGGDIPSASPCVIDTDGDYFDVTGTTNFAAFTVVAGRRFTIQFDGALTMTHHATNIDLPGGANITTAAGDVAEFFATGTNTVQCVNYTKADGTAIAIADNVITLAKMAGGTDGQILSYDANGDPVALGPGTDGQVLTSTGAGSPPAFEDAGGGGVNTPYFDAKLAGNQALTDVTWTLAAFATENYDSGSMYDTSAYRFTPTVAGKYYIYYHLCYATGTPFNRFQYAFSAVRFNGSAIVYSYSDKSDAYDVYADIHSGSIIKEFNGSSDYIEMWAYINVVSGAGLLDVQGQPTFGAFKLIE